MFLSFNNKLYKASDYQDSTLCSIIGTFYTGFQAYEGPAVEGLGGQKTHNYRFMKLNYLANTATNKTNSSYSIGTFPSLI